MKPVSKIIDSVTGSFTSQESATTNKTPTQEIKVAFNDLFAAYSPKVNYLKFIDDFLELQIADSPKLEIEVKQISSQGTIIFGKPTSNGISTYSSTREWATNRVEMRTYADRFNIANMMQMLKNTLSRLRYTSLGGITPANESAFSVDGIRLDPVYADAASTILNLYNPTQIVFEGDFDSIADQMLLIIAKEDIFNRSFASGLNIRDSITTLTGDLVNDLRTQDFQSQTSLGAFDPIVYQANEGKIVLSFDNILSNQEYLNNFEISHLIAPLNRT
jgi:hypothetical protein